MNSLLISAVLSFVNAFVRKFTESKLWALIMRISAACSRSWRSSSVMAFLEREGRSYERSLFARITMSPFTFLEFLQRKIGAALAEKIKASTVCEAGRLYVQNFMALNTRFWGVMLLSAAVVYNVLHAASEGGLNVIVLAVSLIGAVLILPNMNIMGFLNGSKVIDFCKACAGVKNISFDFYDEEAELGKLRIVSALAAGIVTGAVMSVMPLYGLLVPFALFGMLLVLQYPVTGVYAAVFVAPLIPFSSMPLAGVCIWTLISLMIKSVTERGFKWKRDSIGSALILFLFVLLVSCVFSFARSASLTVWAMYFVFIMFYFAIINTITTRDRLYGLLRLFVISGALVALYGVMQYVFGWTTTNAWIDETMFEDETMRVFSTLANPNVLGEYLLLVIPPAAVFFLKDKANTLSKWVYLAVTLLLFVCLILTQSRGCWLGFILAAAIFVTFYEGRWWAFLPLLLCALPFILPETIVDRISSIGNMDDSSTSYRVFIWMGALGILRHYLMGGIGMGEAAFNEVYPFFSYNAIIAPHSHNTFLQLLVEGGIPALVAFLAVIFVFLRGVHRTYKLRRKKSLCSTMLLALGAGVCGFLFQSLFDYTFYNYRVMAVFFMVIGIAMSFKYVSGKRSDDGRSRQS